MGDPKENPRRSFEEKEDREEDQWSLSGMTEVDLQQEEDGRNETPYRLQLNMEKTKEEFEILYTRL
ncbi:MAG: hypothetical protein V4670_03480 [Bacteroidota bacterium]